MFVRRKDEGPAVSVDESAAAARDTTTAARELVLEHLLDSSEAGPQNIAQIQQGTGLSRGRVDQALHRLCESSEALRVAKGRYVAAPPPKPPPPLDHDEHLRLNGHTRAE